MADSGSVQFPKVPGQTPQNAPKESVAKIVSLPEALNNSREAVKIAGEVTRAAPDGIVQIHTDKGDITLRVDPRAAPAEGQRVEVEIPPGRPPQNARVTPEQNSEPRPAPRPDANPTEQSPPRPQETPVDVVVRNPQQPPVSPPTEPVKLEQLTPEQAIASVDAPEEVVRAVIEATIEKTVAKAEIIVSAAQDEITEAVQTILQPGEPEETTEKIPEVIKAILDAQAEIAKPAETKETLPTPSINKVVVLKPETQPVVKFTAPDGQETLLLFNPEIVKQVVQIENLPAQPILQNPDITNPVLTSIPQKVIAKITSLLPQISIPFVTQNVVNPFPQMNIPPALQLPPGLNAFFQTPQAQTIQAPIVSVQIPLKPAQALPEFAKDLKIKTIPAGTDAELPPILEGQKPVIATVIGQTQTKFPVIAFLDPGVPTDLQKAAFFILRAPVPALVAGSEITLLPNMPAAPVAAPQAGFTAVPPAFFTPGSWPVLDEIYQALIAAAPQAAHGLANVTASPNNPGQVGPAALFFMAALRGGDLSQWLGDRSVDSLRRAGKFDLVSRLSNEGSLLNRLSSEPVSQDWRALNLPLYWENEFQKITLHYKHDSSGNDDQKGGKQVRFIFDLALDAMGKVQLDGLFRAKRLDLIVRSEAPFSQAMQMQMRRAYINALEPTEVKGELSFQNKPEQWVTIKSGRQKFGTSA